MDIITKGFLEEFAENINLKKMQESDQFELFANYCIINKEYNSTSFELKNTLTGKATQGIDGLAIIVNNKIVNSVEEIKDLLEMNRYLDVQFILIQTKTSSKFDNKQIENFFRWTKIFFEKDTGLFVTEEMNKFIEMKDFIYKNARSFKKENPICSMFFVTTGKWVDDENLKKIINDNIDELESTNLFEKVVFEPCDAKKIQRYYRKTQEQVSATIIFKDKVTLAPIPDVKVAYSGIIPFQEYKKIIIDDNGKMKSVFDDNIRDYLEQTENSVNKDISSTITNKKFEYFSILNNGVTVVAEGISGAGNELTITDYQIVNGCQTSHILFENKEIEGIESINVPLKIIITDNPSIKNQITRATNNQTAVGIEELESLSEFQRKLEKFYEVYGKKKVELYYERRTNQYNKLSIPKYKIINIETQVKAFASMFLNQPHVVSGYYGKLVKKMGDRIFRNDHDPIIYYTSGLAYHVVEDCFANGDIPEEMYRMRWHILMLMRNIIADQKMPRFNENKLSSYCENIVDILTNRDKVLELLKDIIKVINESDINLGDRKAPERKITTEKLIGLSKNINCKKL
ncbi:AIPR protein [[Clostridium] sordellii]|uniref:AIPR family protein n=1 Tax=Paraclostridium sordellii TaxID=1505 RepID=UPI0005E04EBE|nr:AIPR family protein [Paeniclostridium sordellii]MBX9180190.1 AIPR family protein [Paeniclostridium sordellii]CEN81904.1 AIPR protein [[Clostridium] sordellii] [Paeniclostridium sordellii]CEO08546.1 AIPR protein [[Clostridium] sordellii] [Paeniclostridium sordellii]CEO10646.1 AIPR protein [[Clostridium] sordellii] [Paeniclostridium sordellii]